MKKPIKILISAGGSGGHLFSAQNLASLLLQKKEKIDLLFAASGLKKSPFFKRTEYPFSEISSSKVFKGVKFFSSLFYLLKGTIESLFLIKKYSPDVVVGFGSFHSFPVLLAAKLLRKKVVLFEANCICGKVNSLFSSKNTLLTSQFPFTYFEKKVVVKQVVRFPWIKEVNGQKEEAKKKLNIDPLKKVLLVFGGSQGADFLNQVFFEVGILLKKELNLVVIHIAGSNEKKVSLNQKYADHKIDVIVLDFCNDMKSLYLATDLVVCRSGALTVSELLYHRKAALLVPYPYASLNHQEINANFMENTVKGAKKLIQSRLNSNKLAEEIIDLFKNDQKKIKELEKNISEFLEKEEKKERLEDLILSIAKEKE